MYEIDEVRGVITDMEHMSGRKYGASEKDDVAMRVIADHVRSAMMLINDGVRPGNDGRGYVLRRLLRRSIRSARLLGVQDEIMPELLPTSRDAMAQSYPDLLTNWDTVKDVAYAEEAAFRRTLESGIQIFDLAVDKAQKEAGEGQATLGGKDAFALHDTYGFPIDLTLEMAQEKGVRVDAAEFKNLMQEQKERARADARSKKAGHVDASVFQKISQEVGGATPFVGYDQHASEAKIVGLLVDGVETLAVEGPAEFDVILDRTPFYAESGGQLADTGTINVQGGAELLVDDVQSPIKGLFVHHVRIDNGSVAVGDTAYAQVDEARRLAITRAHTATHMVHKALHEVVSPDALQAGSENSPGRMRFDFRHGKALSDQQLSDLEQSVNEYMMSDLEVTDVIMPVADAKASGAVSLFGEKYGDEVRVVSIGGDWSKELCIGTHVPSTGSIGRMNILSESSIGSGIRRVEALVSDASYQFQATEHALVSSLSSMLKGRPDELPEKVSALLDKVKSTEKQLQALQSELLLAKASDLAEGATRVGSVRVARADLGTVASADAIRQVVLDVRNRLGEGDPVTVLVGGVVGDRPILVVAVNAEGQKLGLKAGDLVREGSKVLGGGGGGKPDLAQGGGSDPNALQNALAQMQSLIQAAS